MFKENEELDADLRETFNEKVEAIKKINELEG